MSKRRLVVFEDFDRGLCEAIFKNIRKTGAKYFCMQPGNVGNHQPYLLTYCGEPDCPLADGKTLYIADRKKRKIISIYRQHRDMSDDSCSSWAEYLYGLELDPWTTDADDGQMPLKRKGETKKMNYLETRQTVKKINAIYLESCEHGKHGCYGPGNTPERIVAELGADGVSTVAAMVDFAAWDGRIGHNAIEWAKNIPHYTCKQEEWLDTDTIHKCHLNHIAEELARRQK